MAGVKVILENVTNLTEYMSTSNRCQIIESNLTDGQQRDLKMLSYYFNGILSLVVITLGLIGNSLTIVVLTRRMMHSSTNCYLTALAVWDSLVLIITLFLITLPEISPDFGAYFPYVVVYIYPIGLIAQTTTIWLTLSFTVERYIAVCHPLQSARMCTIERARHVIVYVCIASFVYNIVRWFDYRIVYNCNNDTGLLDIPFPANTDFAKTEIYQSVYYAWLYPLIMSLIPLVSLAILNMFLISAVRKSSRQQQDMNVRQSRESNVRQSRENNVTIMLVSVVIVFIICQIPAMVYNVGQAYITDILEDYGWKALSVIRNFLVNLNSAVNFLLYCTFGQKFRRIFMRTFCRCFLSDEEFNSLTYHANANANIANASMRKGVLLKKKRFGRNVYDMTSSSSIRGSVLSRTGASQRSRDSPAHAVRHGQTMNGNVALQKELAKNKNNSRETTPQPPESHEPMLPEKSTSAEKDNCPNDAV